MKYKKIQEFNYIEASDPTAKNSDFRNPYMQNNFVQQSRENCCNKDPPLAVFRAQKSHDIKPTQISLSYDANLLTPSQQKTKYKEIQSESLFTGILKFFDEKNGFGFVTVNDQVQPYDVFLYRNEFKRAKVSPTKTNKTVVMSAGLRRIKANN